MTFEPFLLQTLLACNATLLAIACVAVIRFERRWKRLEEFWDSPTGSALSDSSDIEVRHQLEATRRLEKQLGELQAALKALDLKAPQKGPAAERNLPIENAVRMAKLGASVEDLTRNCGLNAGEARLLQKLHGRDSMNARTH